MLLWNKRNVHSARNSQQRRVMTWSRDAYKVLATPQLKLIKTKLSELNKASSTRSKSTIHSPFLQLQLSAPNKFHSTDQSTANNKDPSSIQQKALASMHMTSLCPTRPSTLQQSLARMEAVPALEKRKCLTFCWKCKIPNLLKQCLFSLPSLCKNLSMIVYSEMYPILQSLFLSNVPTSFYIIQYQKSQRLKITKWNTQSKYTSSVVFNLFKLGPTF